MLLDYVYELQEVMGLDESREKYSNTIHKINSINELRWSKKHQFIFHLPPAIDYKRPSFVYDDLEVRYTLNPDIVVIKQIGKSFINLQSISKKTLKLLSVDIYRSNHNNVHEKVYNNTTISDDGTYAYVEFSNYPFEEIEEESKGIKRIINRIRKQNDK